MRKWSNVVDGQPVSKRYTQQDGMVTNSLDYDNPLFTGGRGRPETSVTIGRNGAAKVETWLCPPSQCKPQFRHGILRPLARPPQRGGK